MATERPAALALALALVLGAGAASGHARGFHQRDVLTVDAGGVSVLVTLDVDGSERSRALRRWADADADGVLGEGERALLRRRLAALATRSLALSVSGHRLELREEEAKVDLRGEGGVGEEGISAAVLLRARFPGPAFAGMTLKIRDTSPDRSPVAIEVFQEAPGAAAFRGAMQPGEQVTVRLEELMARN